MTCRAGWAIAYRIQGRTLFHRVRARRRHARAAVEGSGTARDPSRIADIHVRLTDIETTPHPRGPCASWPASASTKRPSSALVRSIPEAGACASRGPPCYPPALISCSIRDRLITGDLGVCDFEVGLHSSGETMTSSLPRDIESGQARSKTVSTKRRPVNNP